MQNTNAKKKYFYSLKTLADFKGRILENNLTGLVMTINDQDVHFRLIGEFNAYKSAGRFMAPPFVWARTRQRDPLAASARSAAP